LRLTLWRWRTLLRWFVRGVPSAEIAREMRLDRKRVLRALMVTRQAMMRASPVDDRRRTGTEIAAVSREEERPSASLQKSARPPRSRFAVLGLYPAEGQAWAEVVPDAEAEQLGSTLRDRNGPSVIPPGLQRYTAVVYRGRFYRLTESGADRAPFGHIEAFWAYLQRQLRAKGGIRRERLGLYLAEFAWRYNHRKLSPAEQVRELLTLIRQPVEVEKQDFPYSGSPRN
jgi:hypothetical protein